MFTRDKIEVNHLRIFGCLVYVHVPTDKRMKLDPLGMKGIFVGYHVSSKAYRVYIPDYRLIEASRDVTFDEDTTFSISRKTRTNEVHDEELEAPRVAETGVDDDVAPDKDVLEYHDMEEPQMPIDSP